MAKFKILIPVDFTYESELAIDLALQIGQAHECQFYLFHVHEGSQKNYRELDRINAEIMEKMKGMVLEAIQRAADQGITTTVEEVYRRMSNGRASHEIIKMAGNISADMIVMGYRPKGRTSDRVLKKTPCTIVLTREKDPDFVVT